MDGEMIHILLVEDEEAHAELIRLAFESDADRYRLTVASTLKEARRCAADSPPDLVITDLFLPDGRGTQFLADEEGDPRFPFVVTTGHGDEQSAVEAIKAGALDYVVKSAETLADMPHIAERALREWTHIIERKKTIEELKKANRKILEQQKAVVEEERLKALLQLAGATAHELNQPLMALLGNIDLMEMNRNNPEKLDHHMSGVRNAGHRISDIVKKIQTIRHDETKPYLDDLSIINLDQKMFILTVEDPASDLEPIRSLIKAHSLVELSRKETIRGALEELKRRPYDLIISDYFLGDGDALDLLKTMGKEREKTPVVVLTETQDEMMASRLIQAGAWNYLAKDKVSEEIISRIIANTMEKVRLKREIENAQEKMAAMSARDELTGLYNHQYFMETLEREVSKARRYGTDLVLSVIAPDRLGKINDDYGHPAAEMVLSAIGQMLKEYIPGSDLAGRYGADGFGVILPLTVTQEARSLWEKFREMVAQHHFKYDTSQFSTTVSVGISSYYGSSGHSLVELVKNTEQALSKGREAGGNSVVEYHNGSAVHRKKLGKILISRGYLSEGELEKALNEQNRRLGLVLLQARRITAQQLNQALSYQTKLPKRLGQVLTELGHTTKKDIRWALDRMKRKLGEILTEKGFISDQELCRALLLQGQGLNRG